MDNKTRVKDAWRILRSWIWSFVIPIVPLLFLAIWFGLSSGGAFFTWADAAIILVAVATAIFIYRRWSTE